MYSFIMEKGIFVKEFYIGRYIYLVNELRKLPRVSFVRLGKYNGVSFYTDDGKKRRITEKNREWEKYRSVAERRRRLKDRLSKLMKDWESEYSGSLHELAKQYTLCPNSKNRYNSVFWESLGSCENECEVDRTFIYDGIVMRSQYETEVAAILDELGIEYKYESRLDLGNQGVVYPDMSCNFPEFNRCGFIEVLGAMDSFSYVQKNTKKFSKYSNSGIYINRDIVFVPGDYYYRPDEELIRKMIAVLVDSFAKMYVIRKSY